MGFGPFQLSASTFASQRLPPPRHLPGAAVHTLQSFPLANSRVASPRSLPSRRSSSTFPQAGHVRDLKALLRRRVRCADHCFQQPSPDALLGFAPLQGPPRICRSAMSPCPNRALARSIWAPAPHLVRLTPLVLPRQAGGAIGEPDHSGARCAWFTGSASHELFARMLLFRDSTTGSGGVSLPAHEARRALVQLPLRKGSVGRLASPHRLVRAREPSPDCTSISASSSLFGDPSPRDQPEGHLRVGGAHLRR